MVGWDGYFYPWIFNINDFEPITRAGPPAAPVHQTFQGDGFVICSFCPRPYDFDPQAVPAPYNHSHRTGLCGSSTPERVHEPEGDRVRVDYPPPRWAAPRAASGPAEASIGAKATNELAVMQMDLFRPLRVARPALDIEDPTTTRAGSTASTRFNPPTT